MEKKILVTQSSIPTEEEYFEEVRSIFETKWLTNMGVKHKELEARLKNYLNVEEISLFNNGHMALYLGIKSLDLKGEVITTPFTFSSTTHAIVQNGLKPVFCDINEQDYTIDVSKIESLITNKTCAIVPVHVYGHVCDVEAIEKIAKKYNLKVIYDAAHAFGIKYKNKSIGSFGDISMFSFHATKVFNTIEGGALTYSNTELKPKLERLKNFGINGPEAVEYVGMNGKMNEFQAAMGICNLRHVDTEILKRKKIYERYLEKLNNIEGIKVFDIPSDVEFNYAYFPIFFDEVKFGKSRDRVVLELERNNIYPRKYFYPIISEYKCYRDYFNSESTQIAKKVSENILTLPLYADLELDIVEKICNIILKK